MSPGGRLGTKLEGVRPYALLILTLVGDLALGVVRPGLGWQAVRTSASYLLEMVLVLPPIFVLIGMLEVWVPRQTIVRNVGPGSGLRMVDRFTPRLGGLCGADRLGPGREMPR